MVGGSQPRIYSMTLYYLNQGSGLWSDSANWFQDQSGAIPNGAIPTGSDDCEINAGNTVDEVPSSGYNSVINSGGTVTANNGVISTNNGTIITNNATVSLNQNSVATNNGTLSTNNGTVTLNSAVVATNNGTISTNLGTISTNNGTVTTNNNTVSLNYGTVDQNNGTVGLIGNIGGGTGTISASFAFNLSTMSAGANVTFPSGGAITVW